MIINERKIKSIIQERKLNHREKVIKYIGENPDELTINELSRIAELVNNGRLETSAYYTDKIILDEIYKNLPIIDKEVIKVLEPSVGVGNFLEIIIKRYSHAQKLIIEVNDADSKSIGILKALNQYRDIPSNVEILYSAEDYVSPLFIGNEEKYDLIIGNPPFTKLSKKNGLTDYSMLFTDSITKNLAGFFLQKSIELADYTLLVMPKYFLSSPDFELTRKRVANKKVEKIIDFGEKGFKGVLIETIGILVNSTEHQNQTEVYSITKNISNTISQDIMTSAEFPGWIIYRDEFFDKISKKMTFDVFTVFRDRQITNKNTSTKGDVRIIKSRNISRDGRNIEKIDGYDAYINESDLSNFSVSKYLERDDVFLTPNMTYYPRVIRKPKDTLVNGSVAILEPKKDIEIKDEHISFLCGDQFEKFYAIARNYSTRSLNIDANSVYFFGLYNK